MTHPTDSTLPRATLRDTMALAADVVLPTFAKGVIIRRPRVVAVAERLRLDARGVRRLQKLRERYGSGPLLLRLPIREQAIVLDPAHARRVLDESPEPFATASSEKVAALSHFEPEGVLISHGRTRADRRRFNETVLESECPRHAMATRFAAVVADEAGRMLDDTFADGVLVWKAFTETWFRIVRRIVLGDRARDDRELTDVLARLRKDANWAFLHPKRRRTREPFLERLRSHVERAEPGSLASMIAAMPVAYDTAPVGQIPQWLFAFDAAGIATFRALALIATHADADTSAQAELARAHDDEAPELPFLRGCVLESVRLWPTTPMILRQTTKATTWDTGVMPAGTGVLIYVPFFHRDDTRIPFADRFTPEIWRDGRIAQPEWPLVPFSDGPAMCPGRQVVLLLASLTLAAMLRRQRFSLVSSSPIAAGRPIPPTLDNFTLRFGVSARTP